MKDAVLRELAAITLSGGERAPAAEQLALEKLSKRDLKRYLLFLRNEITKRFVTVRSAVEPGDEMKKAIGGVFEGKEILYETRPELGAGLELEHGDNIERINVKNIIERAIRGIKDNL